MQAPEIVLSVNDDEPSRYATSRILRRAGFAVLEAATGTQALQIARAEHPPLVILDINLPDMSGVEVCRQLKADPETASMMVLQVSATNIAVSDRVKSLAAGADSFLVEPVEAEELEAVARALLRLYRSEESLRRALAERDLLIKEVNHRVKNSLQLVVSMLSLQGQKFKEPDTRDLFTKAIARVSAIASIHERLYQDSDPLTVDMHSYLGGLGAELTRAGLGAGPDCRLSLDVQSLRLPTEHGIAVALIMNELVMNSFKHARTPGGMTLINVKLSACDGEHARLTVTDTGKGDAPGLERRSGLGTHLVRMLVRQLEGELTSELSGGRYAVHVTFPLRTVR